MQAREIPHIAAGRSTRTKIYSRSVGESPGRKDGCLETFKGSVLEDRNDQTRGGYQQRTHDADQQQKKNELTVCRSDMDNYRTEKRNSALCVRL